METELQKIKIYFGEGKKQWSVNPEFIVSQPFYELWENIHKPMPFAIATDTLAILETIVSLPSDQDLVGCFVWDPREECCCLNVEGKRSHQQILLTFDDGNPVVQENPAAFSDITELSFGERLEIIYDLIAHVKKTHLNVDILKLSRQEYLGLLDSIAVRYNDKTFRVMKQLTLQSVNKLVRKALEDMAPDEVSNQLVLPLEGSYAVDPNPGNSTENTIVLGGFDETITSTIKKQSLWAITRDIEFIRSAFESLANHEDVYIITLSSHTILRENPDGSTLLKVPLTENISVLEGDKLPVYRRGNKGLVARFTIDFYDGDYVVGKFSWDDPTEGGALTSDLFARPRKSPTIYLRTLFNHLVTTFRKEKAFPSPVLNALIGAADLTTKMIPFPPSANGTDLDRSQNHALLNAVDSDNPITAIQGPPGTGKTHVLENVIRELSIQGNRILMTAPSNTAVDNVCRRLFDLPVLRLGREQNSIAPDVRDVCWIQNYDAIQDFKQKRERYGPIYCGTHIGILRDDLVNGDLGKNGLFDVIVFDEAGMTRFAEFLLCIQLAKRVILFGDHQQLPPFPFPEEVVEELKQQGPILQQQWACITQSALEWLVTQRDVSPYLLQSSYRCQNPRLMRCCSTLFYNARVKTSKRAEYYQLSFNDRQKKYPPSTLRLFCTSSLPLALRQERLLLEGKRPGLENPLEATIAVNVFYDLLQAYPLNEITIIAPYRRQVRLIRSSLSSEKVANYRNRRSLTETEWARFLHTRISTVDSFQGGESDAVIICYVRSNESNGIGFVDDPNRINVAHTRCRREMIIIGDIQCLKNQSRNSIFQRLERAIDRDGEIIEITPNMVKQYEHHSMSAK